MKISYDPEADAVYIHLTEGTQQCRVVRLTDDIALDFAEGDRLAGIEVLGARHLGITREKPEVILERLNGVVSATV
jgi:uncharacterized protein YuzE